MTKDRDIVLRFLRELGAPLSGDDVAGATGRALDALRDGDNRTRAFIHEKAAAPGRFRPWRAVAALAAFAVSAAGLFFAFLQPLKIDAIAQTSQGQSVRPGEMVRSSATGNTTVSVVDGSRIEMGPNSVLSIVETEHGLRTQLQSGNVFVTAANATFSLNAAAQSAGVVVLEGKVEFSEGETETLTAGQAVMTWTAPTYIAWRQNSVEFPAPSAQLTRNVVKGMVTRPGTAEGIPDVSVALCKNGKAVMDLSKAPPRNLISEIRIVNNPFGAPSLDSSLVEKIRLVIRKTDGTEMAVSPSPDCGATHGAITDSFGRFVIPDVSAGQYIIRAQRDGYVPPAPELHSNAAVNTPSSQRAAGSNPATQAITVDDQPSRPDITLSLVRAGSISGTVRDAMGRPLVDVMVSAALQSGSGGPVPQISPAESGLKDVASRKTDDRGQYRLFGLPPGDYRVTTQPFRRASAGFSPGTGFNDELQYALTFYPGAGNVAEAGRVSIREGEELSGIDFTLRPIVPLR